MTPFEPLLANSLVVFGTTAAIVLLVLRLRARPAVTTDGDAAVPETAPGAVESWPADGFLLTAAVEQGSCPPISVDDREELLRRISVGHLQAAHPVFRPGVTLADSTSRPSPSRRPATVSRRGRRMRTGHVPLHLVRRDVSASQPPLQ